jgi:hypothetical protein
MSNSASSTDFTATIPATIGSLKIDPRVPIPLPLNYTLSQPLTYKEQQVQVSTYLALHREYRQLIHKPAFRTILRIMLRTRALGEPSATAKTSAELDKIHEYWDTLSEDTVFNKAMVMASLEILLLNDGRIAKLSEFATIVIEYVLDHEYYPEFWPLDSASLAHFKPPYMYKGREYSHAESRIIHEDMKKAQRAAEFIALYKAQSPMSEKMALKLDEDIRLRIEGSFTLLCAFQRKEREELAAKYLVVDGLKIGNWYRVNYDWINGETRTRVAEYSGIRKGFASFLTHSHEILAMRPNQICGSGMYRVLDATSEDMKDLLME